MFTLPHLNTNGKGRCYKLRSEFLQGEQERRFLYLKQGLHKTVCPYIYRL